MKPSKPMKILVVEDEEHLQELIRYNLAEEGFDVSCVGSGEEAMEALKHNLPDLIILDLMLPGMDGIEVSKHLRSEARTKHISILMLTAKGEESEVVAGIEAGADDYVTKPFSPAVLSARVKMILRRRNRGKVTDDGAIKVRALTLVPSERLCQVKGRAVALTATEFRALETLVANRDAVFSRERLVEALHDGQAEVTDRSVDVLMFGLRRKLGPIAGRYIETVRGIGYRFRET